MTLTDELTDVLTKRDYTQAERDQMAASGGALPDGSFPIANRADLENAIHAIGRASDPEKARAHIIARARALGAEDLIPDSWQDPEGAPKSFDPTEAGPTGATKEHSTMPTEETPVEDATTPVIADPAVEPVPEEKSQPVEDIATKDDETQRVPEVTKAGRKHSAETLKALTAVHNKVAGMAGMTCANAEPDDDSAGPDADDAAEKSDGTEVSLKEIVASIADLKASPTAPVVKADDDLSERLAALEARIDALVAKSDPHASTPPAVETPSTEAVVKEAVAAAIEDSPLDTPSVSFKSVAERYGMTDTTTAGGLTDRFA